MKYFNKTNMFAMLLIMGASGCKHNSAPENYIDVSLLQSGRAIAEQHCETCHSIEIVGDSSREDAPPLRTVLASYNVEALGEDFREHIHVGHPDMPDFGFNVKQTEALLAYLKSIQARPNSN